ncbi:MAG: rhomboid family intramembrane serine protease [Rhodothermales bacterium]
MNRFQQWYSVQPRALRFLLTVNVVIYVVWLLVFVHVDATASLVWNHLALNPDLPGILFEPWQLITYSFLHLQSGFWGLIHIGFNMLWLYWIGKEYEELHGGHALFAAYVLGGLGGGLLTVLLHALLPGVGAFGGVVHGASASVLGVITTVALLYPYKSVALIFIGTVRLIYLVIGYLVLNVLFISGSNMSVSAHLGGALFGYLLARGEQQGMDLSSWARIFFPGGRGYGYGGRSSGRSASTGGVMARLKQWFSAGKKPRTGPAKIHTLHRSRPEEEEDVDAEAEVDRILDKISERGYDALTDEEKRILYEASRS